MNTKRTTDLDRTIGARIALLRRVKGLSQTAVGNAIGVTFQQQQKYEKGANRIPPSRMQAMAELLEVSVSELYGEHTSEGGSEMLGFLKVSGAAEVVQIYGSVSPEIRKGMLSALRAIASVAKIAETARANAASGSGA
ncbi:helix-turn-helix domain-containing protein [Methylobacterium sp. Leaf85]|uniref:helix-turn-helix domain-containing protein n=1 Tax=Methylobacterium sp. Leaf85 TaxID=1736241 RepID=UPI0009E70270|nr:helix-turn-helix transcriptional regulator [Methylobacterium sp. Leaf85]